MTFKTQLEADLPTFYNVDEFALSGVYHIDGELIGKTINFIQDDSTDLTPYETGQAAIKVLRIKKSDIARPKAHDFIVSDGEYLTVQQIVSGDGYEWIISVFSDQRGPKA